MLIPLGNRKKCRGKKVLVYCWFARKCIISLELSKHLKCFQFINLIFTHICECVYSHINCKFRNMYMLLGCANRLVGCISSCVSIIVNARRWNKNVQKSTSSWILPYTFLQNIAQGDYFCVILLVFEWTLF